MCPDPEVIHAIGKLIVGLFVGAAMLVLIWKGMS